MPDTILSVRGLAHTFGHGATAHRAIGDISFDLPRGTTLSIVGPSGAGKTTLLRCLAGLLRPSGGVVELDGDRVTGVPASIGVVFQDYSRSLMPWLTVTRNVEFSLRGTGMARRDLHERASEALALVGLSDAGQKHPRELSGGMQQRVAIARAVAVRPRLLLMDEPFASVDAQTRAELEDLTLEIRAQTQTSMVVVTHDIDESVYLSDAVLALSGPPSCVLADVPVTMPYPRDQVSTKQRPDYLEIRSKVYDMIHSNRTTQN